MPSGYSDRQWKGVYCGTYEIAKWANVTKAQIAHWAKEDWFPPTVDEPQMGRIWKFEEVKAALEARGYPRVGPVVRKPPVRKKRQPEVRDDGTVSNAV